MRLLVIEDEPKLADYLHKGLSENGHVVDVARDGIQGRLLACEGEYDLVLLDLMLPGVDGFGVLKAMRERGGQTPVLMLTARDALTQKLAGFETGADDYMVKPFELPELEARVRALTRRSGGAAPTVQFGPLSYDQVGRVALIHGEALDLSARELGLLEVLLSRAGRLVSKDQLVDQLCGWGEEVSHNAIEVYVHRLRKKLEPGGVRIATVRGLGYCLEKPQESRGD